MNVRLGDLILVLIGLFATSYYSVNAIRQSTYEDGVITIPLNTFIGLCIAVFILPLGVTSMVCDWDYKRSWMKRYKPGAGEGRWL